MELAVLRTSILSALPWVASWRLPRLVHSMQIPSIPTRGLYYQPCHGLNLRGCTGSNGSCWKGTHLHLWILPLVVPSILDAGIH
jgi:hypothetical protein